MESFLKKVITPEDSINLLVSISLEEIAAYDTFMGDLTPIAIKNHLSKTLHRNQSEAKHVLLSESLCLAL